MISWASRNAASKAAWSPGFTASGAASRIIAVPSIFVGEILGAREAGPAPRERLGPRQPRRRRAHLGWDPLRKGNLTGRVMAFRRVLLAHLGQLCRRKTPGRPHQRRPEVAM